MRIGQRACVRHGRRARSERSQTTAASTVATIGTECGETDHAGRGHGRAQRVDHACDGSRPSARPGSMNTRVRVVVANIHAIAGSAASAENEIPNSTRPERIHAVAGSIQLYGAARQGWRRRGWQMSFSASARKTARTYQRGPGNRRRVSLTPSPAAESKDREPYAEQRASRPPGLLAAAGLVRRLNASVRCSHTWLSAAAPPATSAVRPRVSAA